MRTALLVGIVALVTASSAQSVVLVGTQGPDRLVGTNMPDVLNGRGGADRLIAKAGKDQLNGGGGKDRLVAGNGRDTIYAMDGHADVLLCGDGTEKAVYADPKDELNDCEHVHIGGIGRGWHW